MNNRQNKFNWKKLIINIYYFKVIKIILFFLKKLMWFLRLTNIYVKNWSFQIKIFLNLGYKIMSE